MLKITDENSKKLWKQRIVEIATMLYVIVVFLTGCSFTHEADMSMTDSNEVNISVDTNIPETDGQTEKGDLVGESEIEDKNGDTEVDQNTGLGNNVYNPVKYYNNYFYFSDVNGFQRISEDLSITETLADGNVILGDFDENKIYYIRYASDNVDNAGIFYMDLTNLYEEKLLNWSEFMWSIHQIYVYQNKIYLEGGNICKAYEFNNGVISEIEELDNVLYQQLDRCGILHEDISALAYGYINTMLQYQKLVYLDRQNNKIIIYDTESGEIINLIDQCESDVLVTEWGIVYKDLDNNILFRKWIEEDSEMLYDISENNDIFVNYGTFDDQYIYGFDESENECILIKITWEGKCETDKEFENEGIAVNLGFSINNGIISFLHDGYRIFEK